jgi:hypothetical protein
VDTEVTRREQQWVLIYSAILMIATSLPYAIGAASANSDWSFTGFVFAVEDGNSYIAKMLTGQEGALLFRSPYSTAAQRGALAFLPYLLLGKLSDGSHTQLVLLFHLFRLASIPLLILAIYRFAAIFLRSTAWRQWVTVLASIGGGLGWVLILFGASDWLGSLPLEFYSPETFGFLSIYGLPHLVLARALWLWAASWYLSGQRGWWAGAALLSAGLVHPPLMLPALAALAAHQVCLIGMGREYPIWFGRLIRLIIPSLPLAVFLGWSVLTDPYLQAWAEQNVIRSPHFAHYLIAYGLLIPPALFGARRLLRERSAIGLLPIGWAITAPALAYAPIALQRRLTDGVWIVLLILAALGMEQLRARWLRLLPVGLLLPGTALLLVFGFQVTRVPSEPIYRSQAETAAFGKLRNHAAPGSIILAAFETGNAMPAWAPVTVVAGHGPETAGLAEILPEIEAFYGGKLTDDGRARLLASYGVDYVFWGPHERSIGSFDPGSWSCLEPIFSEQGYELFRVCEQ